MAWGSPFWLLGSPSIYVLWRPAFVLGPAVAAFSSYQYERPKMGQRERTKMGRSVESLRRSLRICRVALRVCQNGEGSNLPKNGERPRLGQGNNQKKQRPRQL